MSIETLEVDEALNIYVGCRNGISVHFSDTTIFYEDDYTTKLEISSVALSDSSTATLYFDGLTKGQTLQVLADLESSIQHVRSKFYERVKTLSNVKSNSKSTGAK